MKTITQMRDEIAEIMKKLGDMKAQNEQENKEPTSEERREAHDLLNRVDDLKENIELEERVQGTADILAKPKEDPTKPEVTVTSITKADQEKRDSFLSFGEQMQSVIRAGSPGGSVDPRLQTRAASGLNETVQSEGGFLVQPNFAAEIIKPVFDEGKLASRINMISLSQGNSMKFYGVDESSRATGSRWGGIQMYWKEEAGEKTKSKPKFREIDLKLKKLIGLCYLTDELLADTAAIEQEVREGFQAEMKFQIDDAVLLGNGAGRPLGITNSPSLVTVNKETGQSAATILFENVINMWSRLIADSRANAVWLVNQDTEPQLATMAVAVGTGGIPVYMPAGGFAGATQIPFSTLFGRPVIPMEQCSTLGTKNDIILGDFSKYKAIDKGGLQSDISIHVRFIYDEQVLRFVYRMDGQPVLSKAITPYKGTNTLSHFVTLQGRS